MAKDVTKSDAAIGSAPRAELNLLRALENPQQEEIDLQLALAESIKDFATRAAPAMAPVSVPTTPLPVSADSTIGLTLTSIARF